MIHQLTDILHQLSGWIESFAHSDWVIFVLAVVSFTESIISPFPPDPILIAAAVFNAAAGDPAMALIFAAVVTAASVLGALVGHWLGKRFGRPILNRFFSPQKVSRVEALFQKYGVWAIVFAAVTPVPYKVFAVTAGAMDMSLKPFILASVIGRGARMFLWAALAIVFGEDLIALVETQGALLGGIFGLTVIAAFALWLLIAHIRRRPRPHPAQSRYDL